MTDTLTQEMVEDAIGAPIDDYAKNCHAASVAVVRSGLLGRQARVARGAALGVVGQHSWVVCGADPADIYDLDTTIVDITLWSYDDKHPKVWIGTQHSGIHMPHFGGVSLLEWGCPESGGEEEIELAGYLELSREARYWVNLFKQMAGGPLDRRFWATLMTHAPYNDWPSEEITRAAYLTDALRALIPIDRVGMHTNLNPGGLYLRPSDGEN